MSLLWRTAATQGYTHIDEHGEHPVDMSRHQEMTVPVEQIQDGDLVRMPHAKSIPFERAYGSMHDQSHPGNDPHGQYGDPIQMWVVKHKYRLSPHRPDGTPYQVLRPKEQS